MSNKKKKKPQKRAGQASFQRPDWNDGLNDGKMSQPGPHIGPPNVLDPFARLDAAIARHPASQATPEEMSRRLHDALNNPDANPEVRAAAERMKSTIDKFLAPPETLFDHVCRLAINTGTDIQSWYENRDGRRLWVVDMDAVDKAEGRKKDHIDDFGESVPAEFKPEANLKDFTDGDALELDFAEGAEQPTPEELRPYGPAALAKLLEQGPQPNLEAGK